MPMTDGFETVKARPMATKKGAKKSAATVDGSASGLRSGAGHRQISQERILPAKVSPALSDPLDAHLGVLADGLDALEKSREISRKLLNQARIFFDDAETFRVLEEIVIPSLVAQEHRDETLRVWVPGCSTGEEAYSISILLLEQLTASGVPCWLQVFATDVDEEALGVARAGIYDEAISASISPKRLERYFTRIGKSSYHINKNVRECLTFARQNVMTDPPFSRIDLLSCRNVLRHLEPEVQRQVIPLLHFSLRPGGFLVLGSSESVAGQSDLFESTARRCRIYRRIGQCRLDRVKFPIHAPGKLQKEGPAASGSSSIAAGKMGELIQRLLLEEFAPASVLIKPDFMVIDSLGPTTEFLDAPSDQRTRNLMTVAKAGLRSKLRRAVRDARDARQKVTVTGARLRRGRAYVGVTITVKPVHGSDGSDGLLLVTFEDSEGHPSSSSKFLSTEEESIVQQLELELWATHNDLRGTIAELEKSNEDLKSWNEEAIAMNESLGSINDELERSQEKLRALNEELTVLNGQLQEKVEELKKAGEHARLLATVLMDSNDAVTVHDFSGRITTWNRGAELMFGYTEAEALRLNAEQIVPVELRAEIFAIWNRLRNGERVDSYETRRRTKDLRELDVWVTATHLRDDQGKIVAIANTARDITRLKRHQTLLEQEVERRTRALNEQKERLHAVLSAPADAIITMDQKGTIESVNPAAETMFGYDAQEMIGRNIKLLILPPHFDDRVDLLAEELRPDSTAAAGIGREVTARRRDGSFFPAEIAVSEVKNFNLSTAILRDISARRALENEVLEIAAMEQLRIGANLHDEMGQELTALGLLADSLADSTENDSIHSRDVAKKVQRGVNRLLKQMRAIASDLLPVEIDGGGLPSALENLAANLSDQAGIQCVFEYSFDLPALKEATVRHLFLIAREACTNAVKHARARNIRISLESQRGLIVLRIEDDGPGMPDQWNAGLGMRIMRTRCRVIKADLRIDPKMPHGTEVVCTLFREHSHEF
jgi:two-component system CheB/CheR fusion protein